MRDQQGRTPLDTLEFSGVQELVGFDAFGNVRTAPNLRHDVTATRG
jgi:hypothetical protein